MDQPMESKTSTVLQTPYGYINKDKVFFTY
jgi:hypothetical protein